MQESEHCAGVRTSFAQGKLLMSSLLSQTNFRVARSSAPSRVANRARLPDLRGKILRDACESFAEGCRMETHIFPLPLKPTEGVKTRSPVCCIGLLNVCSNLRSDSASLRISSPSQFGSRKAVRAASSKTLNVLQVPIGAGTMAIGAGDGDSVAGIKDSVTPRTHCLGETAAWKCSDNPPSINNFFACL
jgi:hypothetical protein